MNLKFKRFFSRRRRRLQRAPDAETTNDSDVRITNETIAARREEVLGSARKYIYPLQASKRRIVRFSVGIFIFAIVSFLVFCGLELYKFQSTSSFIDGVTAVLPFPVAVINHRDFISYNDYLFQLRRYMHYYQSQQNVDFSTASGKQRLSVFKQRSLNLALQESYVAQLAHQNHLSVSDNEVNNAVTLVRAQNRLGASEQVFENVISEFWGWSVDDFKRELGQELLAQKVVDKLDVQTHNRANQVLAQLQQGVDFAALAKSVSDDTASRNNGGNYGVSISKSNNNIAPQIVNQLFQLQPGEHSSIINTGYSLEIVKVLSVQGNEVRAAHISFNFQPITTYTAPLEVKEKPQFFIHV